MSYGKAIELKATIDSSYGPTSAVLYKKLPQKGHCDEMTVRNLLEPFTFGSNQWIDFVKQIAWSEHGPSESKIYSYFGYVENSARQVVPSPVGCRCCTSGSPPNYNWPRAVLLLIVASVNNAAKLSIFYHIQTI